MSAADDLHEQIFGFTPKKPGTAYERLAAVMLAELGWESVEHQTKLRPEGRRAEQRLDVTATHSDGSVRRLLVECKDWNRDVGKGTMDALVATRANGQPAFGCYLPSPHADIARPGGLLVLTLQADSIGEITWFGDSSVFPHFGLPRTIPIPPAD